MGNKILTTRDPEFYKLRRSKRAARKKERRILKEKFSKKERQVHANARKTKAQRRAIVKRAKRGQSIPIVESRPLSMTDWLLNHFYTKDAFDHFEKEGEPYILGEVKELREQEGKYLDDDEDNDTIRSKFWESEVGKRIIYNRESLL